MNESELSIVRRAFAKQVLAAVGASDDRLEAAFAAVRREDFLGPGPWQIFRWGAAYRETPSADPVYLYTDDLVGLIPERRLNNGQPQLHAHLIGQVLPKAGEHVVHVGTGTGYYTAIMAHMVGREGRVTGFECEPELAAKAQANFADWPQVTIVEGDGAVCDFAPADVIYVNADVTRPLPHWLDRLADGGRLILPLTTEKAFDDLNRKPGEMANMGAVLRIVRHGDDFDAKWISGVAIIPCTGHRAARLPGLLDDPRETHEMVARGRASGEVSRASARSDGFLPRVALTRRTWHRRLLHRVSGGASVLVVKHIVVRSAARCGFGR